MYSSQFPSGEIFPGKYTFRPSYLLLCIQHELLVPLRKIQINNRLSCSVKITTKMLPAILQVGAWSWVTSVTNARVSRTLGVSAVTSIIISPVVIHCVGVYSRSTSIFVHLYPPRQ